MLLLVEVIITNKTGLKDPEGETIHKHLVLRKGYSEVKMVRSGKYLLISVDIDDEKKALDYVKTMCEKLRLYNPVIHDIEVRARA